MSLFERGEHEEGSAGEAARRQLTEVVVVLVAGAALAPEASLD